MPTMQDTAMAQFYIRAYKTLGAWCVDVCTSDGHRSRNELPSFFKSHIEAKKYAADYSSQTGIPLKQ